MEPAALDRDHADAAAELFARYESGLRRVARRVSICEADVDEAIGRSLEILLRKGKDVDRRRLGAWMGTVIRREALSIRRGRERQLGDPVEIVACERPDPLEQVIRRERVAEAAIAVGGLKEHERIAIVLQAQGYSYAEICAVCGWTYTKVNRCLAEGRATLRERARSRITP